MFRSLRQTLSAYTQEQRLYWMTKRLMDTTYHFDESDFQLFSPKWDETIQNGETLFEVALRHRQHLAALLFMQQGAQPFLVPQRGDSLPSLHRMRPFEMALELGYDDVVKLALASYDHSSLLAFEAEWIKILAPRLMSSVARYPSSAGSWAHAAVCAGSVSCLRLLREAHFDFNLQDAYQRSALMVCLFKHSVHEPLGQQLIAELLLGGANPYLMDESGQKASDRLTNALLSLGAQLEAQIILESLPASLSKPPITPLDPGSHLEASSSLFLKSYQKLTRHGQIEYFENENTISSVYELYRGDEAAKPFGKPLTEKHSEELDKGEEGEESGSGSQSDTAASLSSHSKGRRRHCL